MALTDKLTAIADAIRSKTGKTDSLTLDQMVTEIDSISAGGSGGGASVSPKDVNFYDYDGTLLHSYTVAEAQALTELPELPTQPGLICQGWNWNLADIKSHNRAVDVGATYITDDGTTRIYITLHEGRTSPMLGVCPNGTVTVDWGDGTTPDVLTGTSTSTVKWTPNHEYANPGDYVIRLTVDGEMEFSGKSATNQFAYILRNSSSADSRNAVYQNSISKVEIGYSVTRLSAYAFYECNRLASVTIPNRVTKINYNVFYNCYYLAFVTIPNGVTLIDSNVFYNCYRLASVAIPNSVTMILGHVFYNCYYLASVTIPNRVTSIDSSLFSGCVNLASITIPDSVKTIGSMAFYGCKNLAFIIIPSKVTNIQMSAFSYCGGIRFYDFSNHTAVPALAATNAFNGIAADCEIRVPAALYDEWIAATNWATYASKIVAV